MISRGSAVIGEDLIIQGDLKSRGDIDVHGFVTGSVTAERLIVHRGGRVYGNVRAASAEVNGTLQGTVAVRNLISIGSSGTVNGDVRYGQLSLAPGGELSAEVRNVPPELTGDLKVVVRRGRSIQITTEDLDAVDPDSPSEQLVITAARVIGGFVARATAPTTPIDRFTDKELERGQIMFVHDGTTPNGSIDVVVTDQTGATSGAPKTVQVTVID